MKKKLKFNLGINSIRNEINKNLESKKENCKETNDNDNDNENDHDNNSKEFEKKLLDLKIDKTTTIYIEEKHPNIKESESNAIISKQNNENEIKKEDEKDLTKEMHGINCEGNDLEKKNLDLKEKKIASNKILNQNNCSSGVVPNSINESSISDEPTADTLSNIKEVSMDNSNLTNINQETNNIDLIPFSEREMKKFNEAKENYFLKQNLKDKILKNKGTSLPDIYKIGHDRYILAYSNNMDTYCITISEKLKKNKDIKEQKDLNKDKKYYKSLGLYFCGNFIEENKMTCAPNQFMCKECMKINKEKYNLNNKYLIGINGRVARELKDGRYHCYGVFNVNSKFEICSNNFTCQSCDLLNKYSKYY